MARATARERIGIGIAVVLVLVVVSVLLVRRAMDPERFAVDVADPAIGAAAEEFGAGGGVLPGGAAAPPPDPERLPAPEVGPTDRDLEIFREKLAFAEAERLDTLPLGEIIVRLGRTFVGAPYRPGTLEVPGPERVVINLRELDCVTFVENVLVLARMVRAGESGFDTFRSELERVRYRSGELDGYPSRLHYFSEWIGDNEAKGLLRDVTAELGGERDTEPIHFMSRNADAYPQLADPEHLAAIREIESRLSVRVRHVIPEDRIADVAADIRDGDIIAATSAVEGLDVAHTGFAIWIDGRLHLMHAPLVGRWVEISERPLAERIRGISGQDGIMVARPL